ncbi:MAG TPA: VIT domain-containing protein [Polyangiaceae bacterium]|nr:VIT domain-containing protein [Polyangiaceae bacterium]
MSEIHPRARASRFAAALITLLALWLAAALASCKPQEKPLLPRSQTWAELRTVRRAVTVIPPNESERAPFPRERLVDGQVVIVGEEGLAWLRRDAGATLLVRGPARLTLRSEAIELTEGRVFVDTPPDVTAELVTPSGPLELSHVRASIDVHGGKGSTEVYVLAGEVKASGLKEVTRKVAGAGSAPAQRTASAGAGERLVVNGKPGDASASIEPALTWEDWTGGLATTDRAAEPSPFGIGTVGARTPGAQGAPHAPLAIQKLDVRVTIDADLAITEVDEVFFNPTSEVVEGVYRFRTPEGAVLHRFGVDRNGAMMWGRVKEKQSAQAQYQANVYQGSTEDPALLEWDAPGVFKARLYPIRPGEARRVVVQYAEWLSRTGPKGERRLYVYPMAAEGVEASLPHIEELSISIDLAKSGAKDVRSGMAGVREDNTIVVREQDIVPRADLALELFDDGLPSPRVYSAPHAIDLEALPPPERGEAKRRAKTEADYVLVPLRPGEMPLAKGGLDLAIVIDTSAATDAASLAIARAAVAALLTHVGKDDRVVVWSGDAGLRAVVPGRDKLAPIDKAAREAILTSLAALPRGGATDLGAMLSEAASALDAGGDRRGAVVYIGDGAATVGEISLTDLRERMAKLPRPVRIFSLGVGDAAEMAVLSGLARGSFAERIGDAHAAAQAALRLLERAERPAFLGAAVDLGPSVERIFPRDLGAVVADESLLVIGRKTEGAGLPASVTFTGPGGTSKKQLTPVAIDDRGDLSRRWAMARLAQMIDEGTGRAAMVDLGSRHGVITPVTSLYVPTLNEMTSEERVELDKRREAAQNERRTLGGKAAAPPGQAADEETSKPSDESWSGSTRAKGESGSLGWGRDADRAPAAAVAASPPPMPSMAAAAPMPMPSTGTATAAAPAATATAPGDLGGAAQPPSQMAPQPEYAPPTTPSKQAFGGEATKSAPDPGEVTLAEPPPPPAPPGYFETKNADIPHAGAAKPTAKSARPTLGSIGGIGSGPGGGGSGFDGKNSQDKSGEKAKVPSGDAKPDALDPAFLPPSATGRYGDQVIPFGGSSVVVRVEIGEVPHRALRCSAAASLPLEERIGLWRERLGQRMGLHVRAMADVYWTALALCEAPTFRERSRLLSLMLDAMATIPRRVELWRVMLNDLGAADVLYRGILARVRTPQEARELHQTLGLRTIDPGILAKLLKDAKSPEDRVAKLRAVAAQWPDDFTLQLKLLDALEDAGDLAGARALARALRARPDADARIRTAVGELYLRLAAKAEGSARAEDELEARRAFGEIVEFAPDDPAARRRLGDLLRAHGWFADAARQYQTLEKLAPDDPSVALLLAAAAEGLGKLEEAVKWTEKGGAAGSPDAEQGPARTARAFAATYLAWGRLEAREKGRKEEEQALTARLVRVLSAEVGSAKSQAGGGIRAALTWSHPELHPTLWSNALGAPMPAPEGDVTLGIAQAILPSRGDAFVEVRLEPDEVDHAARLGAAATLTVVFDEAGEGEKIVKRQVVFVRGGRAVQRFAVSGGEVREVLP